MKLLLQVLISISLVQASPSMAGSWRVEQDGSGDFLTLQPAVDASASGDTIFIGAGWYQDLVEGSQGISYLARWTDSRDLVFIGESADTVKLGPASYMPVLDGPKGLYSDSLNLSNIIVRNITFMNLHTGIFGYGEVIVEDCKFQTGDIGVLYIGANSSIIRRSSFDVSSHSCVLKNYATAIVEYCQIEGGIIYFENVSGGDIRGCEVVSGQLATYINTDGRIQLCDVETPAGNSITASSASNLTIEDCNISSDVNAILISDPGTSVEVINSTIRGGTDSAIVAKNHATFRASGCDIFRHFIGQYVVAAVGYTNESLEYEVDVTGNYWGNVGPNAFYIDDYILDQNDDPNNKIIVKYSPIEGGPVPIEGTNWGSVKAMFR